MGILDSNPFKWINVGQLRKNPPPEIPFIWGSKEDGLIQERSFIMVHSAEKQGKSMFLLNLAVAGARGDKEYLGIPLKKGGFRTMIVQCEVHLRAMYERYITMIKNGELNEEQEENILINGYRAVTLTNPILFYMFKRKIKEFKPDLVGIDPLSHMLTEDENSNVAVGRGLAPLLKLRDDPGATVIVVHHDAKVSDSNLGRPARQRSRGANRLTADPDSIISLTPVKKCEGPTARLSCSARYGRELKPFRVRLNEDTFWFERYSVEQEAVEQVKKWVADEGGTIPEDELVAMIEDKWLIKDTQGRHRTALAYIKKALDDGVLVRLKLTSGVEYTLLKEGSCTSM